MINMIVLLEKARQKEPSAPFSNDGELDFIIYMLFRPPRTLRGL